MIDNYDARNLNPPGVTKPWDDDVNAWNIEVRELLTQTVVKTIHGIGSLEKAEKVQAGMEINLDHEQYEVVICARRS